MKGSEADMAGGLPRTRAVVFIILLGAISLFADMTYEGARSITGPYLGAFGVTATTIGIVAGLGELIGYAVRLGSGYLADASGRYWAPKPTSAFRSRPAPDLLWRQDPAEIAGRDRGAGRPSPMYASRGRKLAIHEQLREDMASAI